MNSYQDSWRRYPLKRVDVRSWPGRELWWMWRHPVLTAWVVLDSLVVIFMAVAFR